MLLNASLYIMYLHLLFSFRICMQDNIKKEGKLNVLSVSKSPTLFLNLNAVKTNI